MGQSIAVVATRVGRPRELGTTRHGVVTSAIAKQLVGASTLELGAINLDGDDQADRSVHGGPDKSVYCYPDEHAAQWSLDGFVFPSGSVGENVTTSGAVEADVRIGDVWRWGSALVQISQPRAPCYKLALYTGRKDVAATMIRSGRSGWYLRTLEVGSVEATGAMELVERDPRSATVGETFAVMFPGYRTEAAAAEILDRVRRSPALAPEWLGYLDARNPTDR